MEAANRMATALTGARASLARLAARLPLGRAGLRFRLALVFWLCFLLAGTLLLAVNYVLVSNRLERPNTRSVLVERTRAGAFMSPAPDEPLLPRRLVLGMTEAELQAAMRELREAQAAFVDEALDQLLMQSGIALSLMSVVAAGLAWLVAGRALRPVAAITAAANRLSGSNLHERINLEGPADELKQLADTFDRMLGRLDAAFDSQRRFVANASHELRTPLTIMRTEIDVALADSDSSAEQLRAMAERVRGALERSEALIASLLLLARSERRVGGPAVPVDLASAAEDALDGAGHELRARSLRVEIDLRPAVVHGDRALLERAVANLVENAVRHNHEGGWLRVASGARDGKASVWVANSGPVVPPSEVGTLFEPFRRRSASRTGSDRGAGLGLSIVRAVAEAHGGVVAARAPTSGGLEVRITLPGAARLPSMAPRGVSDGPVPVS
jgi:signal transduction histidine kinase